VAEGPYERRPRTGFAGRYYLREQLRAGHIPKWVQQHPRRDYIIRATLAFPKWVDLNHIRPFYNRAMVLTLKTGVEHVVDHIIPLTHPYVCGLTVPGNLRVVPRSVNAAKLNTWHPDQHTMFEEPEQFSLWPRLDLET
jgi:hypothetical protein